MEIVFWISAGGVAYAYFGYPLALMLMKWASWPRNAAQSISPENAPGISLVIPAHNEAGVIGRKLANSLSLYYPVEFQVIVISDGSTDETSQIVGSYRDAGQLVFVDLPDRKGKANALNKGIELAEGEIIVFSDASIMLEERALWEIVQPFSSADVGCVSGQDLIEGGGEGLYGKYELFLRRQESRLGSIVGASGSFYAQRKKLITKFPEEGVAPDFLSVLNTVQSGYRAISASKAIGHMTAVADSRNEFRRKIRTVIRGMTALFQKKPLLNPIRYPLFSFFLLSHKVMRWYVPIFLLLLLMANMFLLDGSQYQIFLTGQVLFYLAALLAYLNVKPVAQSAVARVAVYFTVSNAAILVAWMRYFRGDRQEIWGPSKRIH